MKSRLHPATVQTTVLFGPRSRLLCGVLCGVRCGALCVLLCIAGCASAKKEAAAAAIASSTVDFAALRDEGVKYSPDQAASVDNALRAARDSLAKGDYSKALILAKDIPSQIQELSASIKDRKDELLEDWEELGETVPGLMRAARTRIEHLERARKIVTEPQQVLADAQKQWKSANDAYTADELILAVNQAKAAKAILDSLQTDLKTTPEK